MLAKSASAPHNRTAWLLTVFAYVVLTSGGWLKLRMLDQWFGIVWVANAGLLAALLVAPPRRRPELLACGFAAMVVGGSLASSDWLTSAVAAAANGLEALIAAWFIERAPGRRVDLTGLRGLVRFLIACCLLAPAASAVIWAGYTHGRWHAPLLRTGGGWLFSHSLGLVVVIPLILVAYSQARLARGRIRIGIAEAIVHAVAVTLLTLAIFSQPHPLLYLLLPYICFVTFRSGFLGSGLSTAIIAFIAAMMTGAGMGPIAANSADPQIRMLLVQAFIGCCALTVLPIAVVLSERNRLVQSLSAKERKFRELAEDAPIGILTIEADQRITYANREMAQIAGRPAAQLITEIVGQNLDESLRGQLGAALETTLAENSFADVSFAMPDEGQGKRWFQTRFAPMRDEEQAVIGWIGTVMDVSRLRRSEQLLARRERELRLLADNANDLICSIDDRGRILYASAAIQRMFGIMSEDVLGRDLLSFAEPADAAPIAQALADVAAGAHHETRSFRWCLPDGNKVWVEVAFGAITGPQADRQVVATIRDITERKKAEAAILQKNARLSEANRILRLAENLAEFGHWRYDTATHHWDWSPIFLRLHGLCAEAHPDLEEYLALIAPEQRAELREKIEHAIRKGVPFRQIARITCKDGQTKTIDMQGQGETDAFGQLTGMFGVCQDITAHLDAQHELARARDRAEAAAEARARFLAVMSHEIRTPMTGVLATYELLAQHGDAIAWPQADIPRLIAATQAHAKTLMGILDDVLDQAKFEAGKLDLECVAFDPGLALASAVDMFRGQAQAKGIALECPASQPLCAAGDPGRFHQVVANLLSNAIKFTSVGQVTASCETVDDERFRIRVSDTGIGIAAEAIHQIFEPFAQAENSTSQQFGGTGLGLAIVSNLVAAMGGTLEVESRPAEGSTFTVTLPISAGAAHVPEHPGSARAQASPPMPSGLRVLVVDDTETTRLAAQVHLQAAGCLTQGAASGSEALGILADKAFDVVLVDSAMPGLSGAQTITLIRQLPEEKAKVPILGFTAYSHPGRQRELIEAGAQAVIVKPFTASTICKAIVDTLQGAPTLPRERQAAFDKTRAAATFQNAIAEFPEATRPKILGKLMEDLQDIGKKLCDKTTSPDQHDRMVHQLKGISGTFEMNELMHLCIVFEENKNNAKFRKRTLNNILHAITYYSGILKEHAPS